MIYQVHGLLVSSSTALPLPRSTSRRVDVAYRVALAPTDSHTPRFSRTNDPDDPWVTERWEGQHLAVDFRGQATFRVSRNEVVLVDDIADDADLVVHLLLDHVLPRVVALRGDLMLHASGAVGPSGGAHVFVGATGVGKSTLATALAAAGWGLLDDDGIRVMGSVGGPVASPGYAGVRLLPDAAEVVLPDVVPGRPMTAGHLKRRFVVDGCRLRMADGPAPIVGLYVLERSETVEATALELGFAASLRAVLAHGFHLTEEPDAIARQAFEQASALAAAVPVRRLSCPVGLDRLGQIKLLLEEVDRLTPSPIPR